MNMHSLLVGILSLSSCCFASGEKAPKPSTTEADLVVEAFEQKIGEIDRTFKKEAERLRTDYGKIMSNQENAALQQGDLNTLLWANRYQRLSLISDTEWLGIFKEDYQVPDPLKDMNADELEVVNTLREKGLTALTDAKQEALDTLDELVKTQVRANLIDQAVQTRDTKNRIEKSKTYPSIENRLKRFNPERAAKDISNQEKKREWSPIPPPDAQFPFRKENPAFKSLLKSVKIESSGFLDGPSAKIVLGNTVRYSGTRGLAVVAVNGSEVLIQDTYDTYAFEEESNRLIKDLKSLPYGTFLMLAVRDDATRRFTGSAQSTLIRFGAGTGILNLPYRSSYLMIGLKGLAPGKAVEKFSEKALRSGFDSSP